MTRNFRPMSAGVVTFAALAAPLLLGACKGDETAAPAPTDTSDTGAVDAPGGATLWTSGPIACEDPDSREADGPVYTGSFGADWAAQGHTGEGPDALGGGLTIADLDGDGFLDIYLPQVGADQLYLQQEGTLVDVSSTHLPEGLAEQSTAATAADIDGDGDLDLLVATSESENRLLLNDGSGAFSDGTAAAGLGEQGWPTNSIVPGDIDGDGDLDLFAATWRGCMDPWIPENAYTDTPQVLFENQGDGTFVDVSDRLPAELFEVSLVRLATFLDVDGDGDVDLYLDTDVMPTQEACLEGNRLFVNDGTGHFAEADDEVGANVRIAGMGLGVGDINGDGYPELAMSSIAEIMFLETDGALSWYDSTLVRGLAVDAEAEARWSGWGTELADVDNDGDLDLYMGFGALSAGVPESEDNPAEQPDALYLQGEDGTFTDVAADWGVDHVESTRAVATIDFDGDGFLDLAHRVVDGPATIQLSRCDESAWLEVRVQGDDANTQALGTRVELTAGDQTWTRWIGVGGTGLHSSVPTSAHFGLGDVEEVGMTVHWPDGRRTDVEVLKTRQIVALKPHAQEGAAD